jgi:hypothetical protein
MSDYSNIDDQNKEHLKNLLNWILNEVISAGGDGYALWYSRFYNIDEIFPIVEECNKYEWKIEKHPDRIFWWKDQEGITITNNEQHWNDAPSWQQVMIKL